MIPAFRQRLERSLIITASVRHMSSNETFDGERSQRDEFRSRVRVTRRNETVDIYLAGKYTLPGNLGREVERLGWNGERAVDRDIIQTDRPEC